MNVSEINKVDPIRDRAIRLFTYLRELAKLKTTVTRDLSSYEKDGEVVWFHDVPEYKGCFSILSDTDSEKSQDNIWLEIRKTPEPPIPQAPSSCLKWLENDSEGEPHLKDNITMPSGQIDNLIDHPEVREDWQRYIQDRWLPWKEDDQKWRKANDLYLQLFSIHQQLKKLGEQYELLLGLGLLTWETPNNQLIKRHIVVGDAFLNFDADRAKFELQGSPQGTKLRFETDMIDGGLLPSLDQINNLEKELSDTDDSPWNKEEIDKILRSWVYSISRGEGVYSNSLAPPEKCIKIPAVTFAPAIILRKRTERSQIQFLNKIIEQINSGGNIPKGVKMLCEISENPSDMDIEKSPNLKTEDSTLYLPLESNEEQLQIVHQIQNRRGILVQGPPGTGKSHTIANLICHLLAQGKKILITSQTPRALMVLKKQIWNKDDPLKKHNVALKELADLCVTLLGNDPKSRDELKISVDNINLKYLERNPRQSQQEIDSFAKLLFEIKRNIANTQRLLREQREITTYEHHIAPGVYKGTAAQIARNVKNDESKFNWFMDDIKEDQTCPFLNSEFEELVKLYRQLSDSYCMELQQELIDSDLIPDIEDFIRMVYDENSARSNFEAHASRQGSSRFNILKQLKEDELRALHKAIDDLYKAISGIQNKFTWTPSAISDVLSGNSTSWKVLSEFISVHLNGLREKVSIIQSVDMRFPNIDRKKLLFDSKNLKEHLENGGKLGWWIFAPSIVKQSYYIGKQIQIDGQPCTTLDRLKLLVTYLEVLEETEFIWKALEGKDSKEEGSLLLQVGSIHNRSESLKKIIGLEAFFLIARTCMRPANGLAEPQWNNLEELAGFIRDIEAAESWSTYTKAKARIEEIIRKVHAFQSNPRAHSLNQDMLTALEGRNTGALAQCSEKLHKLYEDRESLQKRKVFQQKLSKAAPKLGQQIWNTFAENIWDQRAGIFEAAWVWKQADHWLLRFSREHKETELETELKRLLNEEKEIICKLAAAKAWDNCLGHLTEFQRQNLLAYSAVNIPKTLHAKSRSQKMREAQKCMDNCKRAIPAWIMPLYRVFETVNPEPETFDVVIIDEASQTGPEGLIIQFLGKQCIVVGDPEQISPGAEFTSLDEINMLMARYLNGIPHKEKYGPDTSLFTHGNIRFSGRVVLREHFRCMPEIIQFSNQLCYNNMLKPLRQYPSDRLDPIEVHHVKDGSREGHGRVLNKTEADELVETIVKKCSQKEYADKTMGVISLLGEAQAKYIENKLLTRLSAVELEKRRIVCGDAYAFQGDERDIIFLSMVDAPNEAGSALAGGADKRRFNVAASRAKDQLVLFHTVTLSDLNNPEGIKYKLLKYCLNPPVRPPVDIDLNKLYELAKSPDKRQRTKPKQHGFKFDSWFEVDVFLKIVDRGFRVDPQYEVADYFIDLVVEGTKNKLAIECHGDKWHGPEQYEKDEARKRILERCRWRFFIIFEHEYYHNPDKSLEPLWKMLMEMGVEPWHDTALDKQEPQKTQQQTKIVANLEPLNQTSRTIQQLEFKKVPSAEIIRSSDEAPNKEAMPNHGINKQESFFTSKRNIDLSEVSGRLNEPKNIESTFDLGYFLAQQRIKFIDKRSQGGALWLIGGHELDPVILELKAKGISFSYLHGGGRVSGHHPAWYSTTKISQTSIMTGSAGKKDSRQTYDLLKKYGNEDATRWLVGRWATELQGNFIQAYEKAQANNDRNNATYQVRIALLKLDDSKQGK